MKPRAATPGSVRRRLLPAASALATQIPKEMLHPAALAAIRARPKSEPVVIACSGGADSVALLLLLWAHLPEKRGCWLVLHFNHRLRGAASAGDASFVRGLARALGERCVVGQWRRGLHGTTSKVSEAEARDARWAFFRAEMRTAGAQVVVLGHQLDDVAETMLMRLARGSGTRGLAAPRPVQAHADSSFRVRPLLQIPAATLRDAAREAGVVWREDATNGSDEFLRNRVRRRVLPALLAATRPNALVGFGDARAKVEEDDVALETWLDELLPPARIDVAYDLSPLRARPVALIRRAMHRWACVVGLSNPLAKSTVDGMVAALVEHREHRLSAGPGQSVVLQDGKLFLVEPADAETQEASWPTCRLNAEDTLTGPRGDRLALKKVRLSPRLRSRIFAGEFSPEKTAYLDPGTDWPGWFGVRSWQAGDRYRPLRAPGRATLQDLFVNRRIPQELRPLLPVVVSVSGEPLWVPGLSPAHGVAIQPASKLVVQLTYAAARPTVHRPNR